MTSVKASSFRKSDWAPSSAEFVCYSHDGAFLALLRDSGRIEIRLPENDYAYSHSISLPSTYTISCLTFIRTSKGQPLLVAGTFQGSLLVIDISTCLYSMEGFSYGGPVFSLAPHPSFPALFLAGCDDGCVRLFCIPEQDPLDLRPPSPVFSKAFNRSTGKVVSLAINRSLDFFVAGYSTGITRVFSLTTSREIEPHIVHPGNEITETVVRSICLLTDGTIITGDGSGNILTHEAKTHATISKYSLCDGPIIGIISSKDCNKLLVGSTDGRLVYLIKEEYEWRVSSSERPHLHDGMGLAVSYCGGRFAFSCFDGNCVVGSTNQTLISQNLVGLNPIVSHPQMIFKQINTEQSKMIVYRPLENSLNFFTVTEGGHTNHDLSIRLQSKFRALSRIEISQDLKYLALISSCFCSIFDLSDVLNPIELTTLPEIIQKGVLFFVFGPNNEFICIPARQNTVMMKLNLQTFCLEERRVSLPLPITSSIISADFNYLCLSSFAEFVLVNFDSLLPVCSALSATLSDSKALTKRSIAPITASCFGFYTSNLFLYMMNSSNNLFVFNVDLLQFDTKLSLLLNRVLPRSIMETSIKSDFCNQMAISSIDDLSVLVLSSPSWITTIKNPHDSSGKSLSNQPPSRDQSNEIEEGELYENVENRRIVLGRALRKLKAKSNIAPTMLLNVRIQRLIQEIRSKLEVNSTVDKSCDDVAFITKFGSILFSNLVYNSLFVVEQPVSVVSELVSQRRMPIKRKRYGR
ncbi:hypothetical protein RCL1_002038 [Eukaryota sp. TZLM3-RCL]